MRHEWRSNLWLILELAIVGVVLWTSFTLFIYLIHTRMQHYGYDMTDMYCANVKYVPKASDAFQQYPDSTHSYVTDLAMIKDKIRSNPYVEMVGLGQNSMPYNFNFYGNNVSFTQDDSTYMYYGNQRFVSPEIIRMLRLEGFNGETTEQLANLIEKGEILLSNFDNQDQRPGPSEFVGRDIFLNCDSSKVYHVGGSAYGIQRSDYEGLFAGVIYTPLPDGWGSELAIRVKPGMGRQFMESITTADTEHGNVYLSNLRSVEQMRISAHSDITNVVRGYSVCAGFLTLIVFLGFLGSFWFRIQQRTSEIAIRVANGATRTDILRRLLGEGMVLLCVGTALSLAIELVLIHYNIVNWGMDMTNYIPQLAVLTSVLILTLMVVAGIWLPARKAMRINPATALKDQ